MSPYANRRSVAKAAGFSDEVAQVDDQLRAVDQVRLMQRQRAGQLLGLGEQLQRRALPEVLGRVVVGELEVVGQQRASPRVCEIDTKPEVVQRGVGGGVVSVTP